MASPAFLLEGTQVPSPCFVVDLDALRANCCEAAFEAVVVHDSHGSRLQRVKHGELKVWREPEAATVRNRYVVAVDVGGRSERSDWSVITVFDRLGQSGMPEVAYFLEHFIPAFEKDLDELGTIE